MLSVYDSGQKYPITEATNFYITHVDGGLDTLNFDIQTDLPIYKHIAEENCVEYGENDYTIKSIDAPGSRAKIKCKINLDFLKVNFYKAYDSGSVTLPALLSSILPAGWTIGGYDPGISRTISLENATNYDVVMQAMDTYSVKFRWSTLGKSVTVIDPSDLTPSGEYLTDELNLRSIAFKGESTDLVTRLYPYGKDGLTIANINGGIEYIENYQYSNKVISASWTDERYTVAANLKADAEKKLAEMAVPVRSYECDVIDLAKLESRYAMFDFALYKVVTLIDRVRGVRMNHQILEYQEYPEQPQKNIITLASVVGKIQTRIDQAISKVQDTVIQNANIMTQFSDLMANAVGYYRTDQIDETGKTTCYLHDKPLLTESGTIWKFSVAGFAVSNDGGQTWGGGFTADSNLVAKVLDVVGVNADWINVGTLTAILIKSSNYAAGTAGMKIDLNAGTMEMNGGALTIRDGNNQAVITAQGVKLTFVYSTSGPLFGFDQIGWENNGSPIKLSARMYIYIPTGITVTKATAYADIISKHFINSGASSVPSGYYTASNIKLYINSSSSNLEWYVPEASEPALNGDTGTQNSNFGTWNPSASSTIQRHSADITSAVTAGQRILVTLTGGADSYSDNKEITDGALSKITVVVEGFKQG